MPHIQLDNSISCIRSNSEISRISGPTLFQSYPSPLLESLRVTIEAREEATGYWQLEYISTQKKNKPGKTSFWILFGENIIVFLSPRLRKFLNAFHFLSSSLIKSSAFLVAAYIKKSSVCSLATLFSFFCRVATVWLGYICKCNASVCIW